MARFCTVFFPATIPPPGVRDLPRTALAAAVAGGAEVHLGVGGSLSPPEVPVGGGEGDLAGGEEANAPPCTGRSRGFDRAPAIVKPLDQAGPEASGTHPGGGYHDNADLLSERPFPSTSAASARSSNGRWCRTR